MHDLLLHDFIAAPYYPDTCDRKLDDAGHPRTCGRPAQEHLDQQAIGSLPVKMPVEMFVEADGPYVNVNAGYDGGQSTLLAPDEARALARALLVAAHVAERGPR